MDGHPPQPDPSKRRAGPVLAVAGVLLAAAAAAYGWLGWTSPPPPSAEPPPESAQPTTPPEPPAPVASATVAEATAVDPDALLRKVAERGSASPLLHDWLDAQGLLQRFAAAVHQISQGRSPRQVLGFISIPGRFEVIESWDPAAQARLPDGATPGEDRIYVDPASYQRYDGVAAVMRDADVEAWAAGYRRLSPHLERVYAEVAAPGERFEHALARALDRICGVQVPTGALEVVEKGALFQYADPKLEGLDEVSKHLLRMGPENAGAIQAAAGRFMKAARLGSAGAR